MKKELLFTTILTAQAFSASLTLTWDDNSDNEDGFIVERRDGESEFVELARTEADVETYLDTGLPDGAIYTYRVCAFNSQVMSDYSNEATGELPLGAPTTLTITVNGDNVTIITGDNVTVVTEGIE